MGWYRLQLLFFLGCSLFYVSSLWIFWLSHSHWERYQEQERFSETLQRRNHLLSVFSKEGELTNTDLLLSSLSSVLQTRIQEIRAHLDQSKWRELAQMRLPLASASGLFVARNGRLRFQKGHDFEEVFGHNWALEFLLGLSRGGRLFEERSRILRVYHLSESEFWNTSVGFVRLYVNQTPMVYFIERREKTDWMWILNLDQLVASEWSFAVQSSLSEDPAVLASRHDGFSDVVYKHDVDAGLWFQSRVDAFPEWCLSIWPVFLLLGILQWFLYHRGGWLLFRSRFAFRLAVLFLMAYLIMAIVALMLQRNTLLQEKVLVDQQSLHAAYEEVLQLEAGFDVWPDRVAEKLDSALMAYETTEPLPSALSDCVFIDVSSRDIRYSSPKSNSNLQLLHRAWPSVVLGRQGEEITDESVEALRRWMQDDVPQTEDRTIMEYASGEIAGWVNLQKDHFEGKLVPFRLMREGFYSFFQSQQKGENLKIILGFISGLELSKLYIKDALEKKSFSIPEFRAVLPGEESSISRLYRRLGARKGEMLSFDLQNEPMRGIFIQSSLLEGGLYLAAWPKESLYSGLRQLKTLYTASLWLASVVLILGWWFSLYRLLRPVQALISAFHKIRTGVLVEPFADFKQDQAGQLMLAFNRFLGELERRNRIASFLGHSLREFLKRSDLTSGGIEDSGTVLFCDIRSFTTLSESYPPETVVDMLNHYFEMWQECIEKEGGMVEKFVGDAVSAVFLKSQTSQPATAALNAATLMQLRLKQWNRTRRHRGEFEVQMGVGVAYGDLQIGILETPQRMELRMFSDTGLKAEKLEGLSKHGRLTRIFVDPAVKNMASEFDFSRFADDVFELRSL